MKTIRLYCNPNCLRCARSARALRHLDWRKRLEISTAIPQPGPLRLGEIAIEDVTTGQIAKGHRAFAQLCRHIPLYAPAALLLLFPFSRAWLDRALSGCTGDECGIKPATDRHHQATRQRDESPGKQLPHGIREDRPTVVSRVFGK